MMSRSMKFYPKTKHKIFVPLDMKPVAGYVNRHRDLEKQHVIWIKIAQGS